jgi:hypothetical protein
MDRMAAPAATFPFRDFPLWEYSLVPVVAPKRAKLAQLLIYPFVFNNLYVVTMSYIHFRHDDMFPREHLRALAGWNSGLALPARPMQR